MPTRAEKNAAKAAERAQSKAAAHDKRTRQGGGVEGSGAIEVPSEVVARTVVDPKRATSKQLPIIRSAKKVAEDNVGRAEEAQGFGEWMAATLPRLDEYEAADPGTQAEMKEEVELARDYLNGILDHHDPLIRRAAWKALLEYRLGQEFHSHETAQAMFDRMVGQGWLVPTPKPDSRASLPGGVVEQTGQPATIYGKTYGLPPAVPFAEKDIVDLQTRCKELRARTMAAVKQDREARMDEIAKQATITVEQCRDHVPGLVVFNVTTQEIQDKDDDKKKKVLQGGRLLMESDGTKLYIRDVVNEVGYGGIGVFERQVRQMMEMRTKPHLLIDPTFQGKKPHFRPGTLPQEMIGKVFLLACMVIRAIDAHFHPDTLTQEMLKQAEGAEKEVAGQTNGKDGQQDGSVAKSDQTVAVSTGEGATQESAGSQPVQPQQ